MIGKIIIVKTDARGGKDGLPPNHFWIFKNEGQRHILIQEGVLGELEKIKNLLYNLGIEIAEEKVLHHTQGFKDINIEFFKNNSLGGPAL